VGRRGGLTERDLAELSTYETSTAFSEVEKSALRYAEAMTRTPADVPQELYDDLARHFDAKQLVELTSAIAWENYRSRFNRPFDVQSGGYSEGAVCAVPAAASRERVTSP
jgi:alkylhydroperoxidase family enzyme